MIQLTAHGREQLRAAVAKSCHGYVNLYQWDWAQEAIEQFRAGLPWMHLPADKCAWGHAMRMPLDPTWFEDDPDTDDDAPWQEGEEVL